MLLYLILISGGVGLILLLLKLASAPSPGKSLKRRMDMKSLLASRAILTKKSPYFTHRPNRAASFLAF